MPKAQALLGSRLAVSKSIATNLILSFVFGVV
jgi:hypothetical protein